MKIKWGNVTMLAFTILFILALVNIALSESKTYKSYSGSYTCKGTILKLCNSSAEVEKERR